MIRRDGQKKRCFTYRFLSTGTLEEKTYQRQLSKEGLAAIIEDKVQINAIGKESLRDLFFLQENTSSDTHDTLKCTACYGSHAARDEPSNIQRKVR